MAAEPNAIVLDGEVVSVAGLTFAGIGDPRFTPDQRTSPHTEEAEQARRTAVVDSGAELAAIIRRSGGPVDVAAVHDPLAADPLDGEVPVILAGHTHERRVGPVLPATEVEEAPEPSPNCTSGRSGCCGSRTYTFVATTTRSR